MGGRLGGGGRGRGQGGCEQRIEVFVKIQKKIFFLGGGSGVGVGGSVGGVRLGWVGGGVKKNFFLGGGSGGGLVGGSEWM